MRATFEGRVDQAVNQNCQGGDGRSGQVDLRRQETDSDQGKGQAPAKRGGGLQSRCGQRASAGPPHLGVGDALPPLIEREGADGAQ